jgi:hypothetical protein
LGIELDETGGLGASCSATLAVLSQPRLQHFDRGQEVVTKSDQQVDIVEVLRATEAVGQVIAGVDGRSQVARYMPLYSNS